MRTRMKSEERRATIVAEAVRLFAEKGFRGTTTRELAAALGVTEPVLYQHFKTKQELYSAIIESKAREGTEAAAGLRPYLKSSDDVGFLSALAELILTRYEHDPAFIRLLFFSALERHDLAQMFFKRQTVRFFDLVAGYIRQRVQAGAFRDVHPKAAARSFIGMVSYHGLIQVLHGDSCWKRSRKRLIDQIVTTFLEGIRTK